MKFSTPYKGTVTTGKSRVSYGDVFFDSDEVDHVPKRVILHPNWSDQTGHNDICLMELNDEINFETEIAQPVCVAEPGDAIWSRLNLFQQIQL